MNKYLFTINGKDFSPLVHKYGYETALIPVFSRSVTTLDKVDHMRLIRMRGQLTVRLNPTSEAQIKAFAAELSSLPAAVGYHNFQLGKDVTQNMKISDLRAALALITPSTDWMTASSITFDEL